MTSDRSRRTADAEAPVLSLRSVDSIAEVDAVSWDRLTRIAGRDDAAVDPRNPFVSHAFLKALEDSRCVGRRAGWLPQHLLLEDEAGRPVAAAPAYLKSHSQGEYVFDHGWADAFERAGGDYYPKLQLSVPFTPASGPRLLVGDGQQSDALRRALCDGVEAYVDKLGISSAHATFLLPDDLAAMESRHFLHRTDKQFHFHNRGYGSYDDFLETLASRKRKGLRKERREALAEGIEIEWLTGAGLTEAAWDAFFTFYQDTGSRKWGRPYLNRPFFSLVGEAMGDWILLVMAKRAGRYIAGALNFIGGDTIYGRYWGCIEDHPFLHFEVCYHQAIDYAIANGLSRVEAGAQGEHKLARGYEPVTTHSAHYIAHPGLRRAIADYLEQERASVNEITEVLAAHTPFRKSDD
ncbi:GNAT family N-acetyltransferase [Mangrovibrevibacter kandeliae]|uniref:GNAT family N-acetyltransferase n=1 Tax=Mangrovibrevibacter kandeliae TaxID=2968473 RepID=UPI002117DC3F|nr:GNAT family N-acetyltransferase [Aurantimonas sp. CSK15Z-1]MCQ8782561.1 GNAT family N-acetyltransferase [Aurantimonas sp. CSK15Z-1]